MIDDPEKFANDLVEGIKKELGDEIRERQDGLMGMINQVVNATREFPDKLNELRERLDELKVC